MWREQGYVPAAHEHAVALRDAQFGNAASLVSDLEKPEPPFLKQIGKAADLAREFLANG
jgi:hypothetical protein